MTIAEKYHDAFVRFFNAHKNELKKVFEDMHKKAVELGVDKQYRHIWDTSSNIARDLASFARSVGLGDEYEKIMKKVKEMYKKELGKEYSSAWGKEANELSKIALNKKLNVIYSLLTRGAYDSAARLANIDPEDIRGLPVKEAMSIISKQLISEDYRNITGKLEPSERFRLKKIE